MRLGGRNLTRVHEGAVLSLPSLSGSGIPRGCGCGAGRQLQLRLGP